MSKRYSGVLFQRASSKTANLGKSRFMVFSEDFSSIDTAILMTLGDINASNKVVQMCDEKSGEKYNLLLIN